mmetsp:Transcript_22661/g.40991  ORF Transcript_22661/g.40991 Transcript_22661/m.40991 type:complete len:441 (-) Transcript_22661:115-1437(-)
MVHSCGQTEWKTVNGRRTPRQEHSPSKISGAQAMTMQWQPLDEQLNFRGTWNWLPRSEEEELLGKTTLEEALNEMCGQHLRADSNSWQTAEWPVQDLSSTSGSTAMPPESPSRFYIGSDSASEPCSDVSAKIGPSTGEDDSESVLSLEDVEDAFEASHSDEIQELSDDAASENSSDSAWREVPEISDDELTSRTSRCGSDLSSHCRELAELCSVTPTGKQWKPWRRNVPESKSLSQADLETRMFSCLQAGCIAEAEQWTNMLLRRNMPSHSSEGLVKELERLGRLPAAQGLLTKLKKSGFKLEARAEFEAAELKVRKSASGVLPSSPVTAATKFNVHAPEFVPGAAEALDKGKSSLSNQHNGQEGKTNGRFHLQLDMLLAADSDSEQRRAQLVSDAKTSLEFLQRCKLPPYQPSTPSSSWLAVAMKGLSSAAQLPQNPTK